MSTELSTELIVTDKVKETKPDDSELHTLLEGISDAELKIMEKLLAIRDTRIRLATEHHVNTHGERMDFAQYPHIRALYNSVAKEIVLQGSVQSLKSEWCVIDHFAAAFHGLALFFVIPKYDMRTTYVQNRINRCVESVAEYKRIIGSGFFDNIGLKNFGAGVIKYVSSNVLTDFVEFPADAIYIEEVDQCNAENLTYAEDRLKASKYKLKRFLGNPRIPNKGINAHFVRSDQREWEVPCRTCGEYSEMDWFKTVVVEVLDREGNIVNYKLRDKEWTLGCGRDIYVFCPKCREGILDRQSQFGQWVTKNPESSVEGYHISMLCSPANSIASMLADFQKAVHNPGKMQHFYNSILGLPFVSVGNKITEMLLDSCREKYEFIIDKDKAYIEDNMHLGPCSMGIDVNGGIFDVRVSYVEPRGRRRAVFVGKVPSMDELIEIITRYNVEKAVIDSLPEVTLVQDFQSIAPCDVWACRYRGEGSDRRKTYDTINRVVNIDRTEALDRSFAQFRDKRNILPKNYANIYGGVYVNEMCGPIRQVAEDPKGNIRYEWTKCEDHSRHSDTYDLLASSLLMEATLDEVTIG